MTVVLNGSALKASLQNLIGSAGSYFVGYTNSGTGATPRRVQDRLREVISVTDYANLCVTRTGALRGVNSSTGWIGATYIDWQPAVQAALDEADRRGGGIVLNPKQEGVTYYISDVVLVGSNTVLIFGDELVLANCTSGGGIFGTDEGASNSIIINPLINGSNLYTGGSGENGLGFGGSNHKCFGGQIRNCKSGNNNDGTGDGGKAVQNETEFGHVVVDGLSVKSCYMALSTRRDYASQDSGTENGPQIFSNITMEDCPILLFVQHSGSPLPANDNTGQQHSVILNGFSAKNCGSFEGAFQFSSASNVLVSNGIVTNEGFTTPAFIKGRTRYSRFVNVQFAGDVTDLVDLSPGTYCTGTGASEQNHYDIQHIGAVGTVLASSNASDKTLTNSTLIARLDTDVTTALVDADAKSATTQCVLSLDAKTFRGTSDYLNANLTNFAAMDWDGDVLANSEAGAWDMTVVASTGAITTLGTLAATYTKEGRKVTLTMDIPITTNGTAADGIRVETDTGSNPLPSHMRPPVVAVGSGVDATSNAALVCQYANATDFIITKYDGSHPGSDGARLKVSITYYVSA